MTQHWPLRVLVVSPYCPYPPTWGAATRVYQLIRHLSARHSVTLVSYASPGAADARQRLLEICDDVRLVPQEPRPGWRRRQLQARSLFDRTPFRVRENRSRRMQTVIEECLRGGGYDVVQIESSTMTCFEYATDAPLVLDEHNIESELLRRHGAGESSWPRRRFNDLESWKQERLEGSAWRKVAACAVTSEREVATVASQAPRTAVAVVPNAVDVGFFSPAGNSGAVNPRSIVFTGLMSYRPNLDGARYMVEEILPRIRAARPETVLTIVGAGNRRDLDALRREGVTVTGFVPDVRPFIAGAACIVVPLRMGGGTRLKVVEALGMGKPMVSTSLGCEGIGVAAGEHLLVADGPVAFAAAVRRVLDRPELGRRLGRAGRELVVAGYSWQHSAQRLAELFEAVTTQRPANAFRADPANPHPITSGRAAT